LSITDHIFCIHQILEKKWEYIEAVHQLFIYFKKAYDSVRRKLLYNFLIEFGIAMKLIRFNIFYSSSNIFPCSKFIMETNHLSRDRF